MKLQRKINNNLLKSITLVALPFMLLLYLSLTHFVKMEQEEELHHRVDLIVNELKKNPQVSNIATFIDIKELDKISNPDRLNHVFFKDEDQEEDEYLELITEKIINEKAYAITVWTPTVENEDLYLGIFFSTLLLCILLIGFIYYFNTALIRQILKPFYNNLDKMNSFSLSNPNTIAFEHSAIDEFNAHAVSSQKLADKVQSDYSNLKQFTENASHEIQTPLAIIKTKTEELLNSDKLNEIDLKAVNIIAETSEKLSGLNKNLLLLSKIENTQYQSETSLNFTKFMEDHIEKLAYYGLISPSKIIIKKQKDIELVIDPNMAEILVKNITNNMLLHSEENTVCTIEFAGNTIQFKNPGDQPIAQPEKLFTRFYKESTLDNSNGLGLAIVKAICDNYGFTIAYTYEGKQHVFTLQGLS